MKTKHILTAMVLPTVLAACTADEIVENNNAVLKNRAQVEAVTFTAEGVESRIAYEDGVWNWEDTDKFLLLNADNGATNANEDKIPGAWFNAGVPTTGYEYAKGENGVYTTAASVMTEGLYWGYAPSFNKTKKGYIEYTLATSQDQDYYKSEDAQVFITPLYEVKEGKTFNNKLPLEMINWYSKLVMPLTNNTKEDITLNQIVLTADYDFVVKGLINTTELDDFVMAYDGEEWAPKQNFDDDDENDLDYNYAKNINEMIAGNNDGFKGMRKSYLTATDANSKKSNTIVLNLDEVVLEAGETETFYMLVPATNGKISCDITIIAEEGVIKIDKSADSNKLKNTEIYHNGNKHAFGTITSGKNKGEAKAYSITAGKFEDVTGAYYVASYDDMMNHIETVNGTFFAYNVGDWNLDAEMAEAIKESDAFVVFMNDINIEGKAISRAADKGLELTKVAFAAEATVLKDTKVTFASEGGDYEEAEGTEAYEEIVKKACVANLIVEKGADVTLVSGEFHSINNAGTLTVASTADFAKASIENAGVLNLVEENAKAITLKGGELNYKVAKAGNEWATDNANVTFALAANAKITVAEGVTLTNEVANDAAWRTTKLDANSKTVTKHAISVENNGVIMLGSEDAGNDAGSMTIWGSLTNNGDILKGYNATLTIAGTATNAADAKIKVKEFVNYGTLTNNGDLRSEGSNSYGNNNFGLIIVGEGSRTDIDNNNASNIEDEDFEEFEDKVGRINNSVAAVVKADVEQIVYCEFDDADEIDLEEVRYASRGINTLRITGTLTLNRNFGGADAPSTWATEMAGLKRLELANNAEIEVFANDIKIGVSEVVLEGNATISGTQESESELTFAVPYNELTLNYWNKAVAKTTDKGYKLTVDGVKVTAIAGTEITVNAKNEKTSTAKPYNAAFTVVEEDGTFFTGFTMQAGL